MKNNQIVKTFFILIAAIFVILTAIFCFSNIQRNLNEQIEENLQDVANQNAIVLNNEINGIHDILLGMAKEMQIWQEIEIEDVLSQLEVYNDVYNFVRIGFVYPDGTAYMSDGNRSNFSNEQYFKNSMQGKNDISAVLYDVFDGGAEINVFSVPVYRVDGGPVEGVLLAVCRTKDFMMNLKIDSFDGKGHSFVVETDGSIISNAKIDTEIKSIFDDIGYSPSNEELSKQIKDDMLNGRSGYGVIHQKEDDYVYYMPLTLELENHNWYVFTTVPRNVLNDRIIPVLTYTYILLAVLAIVLICIFVGFFYSYFVRKKQFMELAYVDKLTGGANYPCFIEKINNIKGREGYIVSAGIEEFHIINNVCGVEIGNEAIKMIYKSMLESIKEQEMCAHVHSDRFIIFFKETNRGSVIGRIGELTQKIMGVERQLNVPKIVPHFGICYLNKSDDIDSIYERAKQAKYEVKNNFSKNYCFVDEIDVKKIEEDKKIEDEFAEAIENKRFEVWYQPKYIPSDNTIVSAEALVRLRDVDGTLISPGRFIPIFERNGNISELDEYVFKEVCMKQKQWKDEGKNTVPISVNISRASLYYTDVVDRYKVILNSYGLDSNDVGIEITESAAINNDAVHKLVNEFHSVGFTLSLDDFGSGYSSLAALNELHFDILKLDKSLIDYIGEANGEKLLYHIVQLAKGIGLRITAEGVETKAQVEFLSKLKCDDIQGFYFSKPLPCEEYCKLIFG